MIIVLRLELDRNAYIPWHRGQRGMILLKILSNLGELDEHAEWEHCTPMAYSVQQIAV